MAVDFDGILKGKFNFKAYGHISKFFELVVVNFPSRMEDLMDSLISGASKVVIHAEESPPMLERMLELSDGVVLPAKNPSMQFFVANGGKYLISDHEVFSRFDQCYNVGKSLLSEKYINVSGFPESLLPYI